MPRPPSAARAGPARPVYPCAASRSAAPEPPVDSGAEPDPDPFLVGAEAVRAFVAREWRRRLDYRLKKEVWSYSDNRVSILFEYEWHDPRTDQWMLSYGEEHWEITPEGLLHRISASGKDVAIAEIDRWILPKPVLG